MVTSTVSEGIRLSKINHFVYTVTLEIGKVDKNTLYVCIVTMVKVNVVPIKEPMYHVILS